MKKIRDLQNLVPVEVAELLVKNLYLRKALEIIEKFDGDEYSDIQDMQEIAREALNGKEDKGEVCTKEFPSIFRICEHCNKEYEIKFQCNGDLINQDKIHNFSECPNCGVRDDPWIKVESKNNKAERLRREASNAPPIGREGGSVSILLWNGNHPF